MTDNEISVSISILTDYIKLWKLPIKETVAIETAIEFMQLYITTAKGMPEERLLLDEAITEGTIDNIRENECRIIHNQARQSCIFAFMKALPTDEAINDIIISICKELNPNFVGEIFIADNYYAPPNNWTRVSTLKIATAIHARIEKGVKNE